MGNRLKPLTPFAQPRPSEPRPKGAVARAGTIASALSSRGSVGPSEPRPKGAVARSGLAFPLAVLLLVLLLPAAAQVQMTVAQLKQFVRSSLQLRHEDSKLASYLKQVKLTERLDDVTIETLMGEGAGSKTIEALRALRDATAALPKPSLEAAQPPAPTMAPPSSAEQRRIIEEARELALSYTKRLPDFICLQVTRRYFDPSGLGYYSLADTVAARLSYFEQREDYKVISINGRLSDVSYDQLSGATSSGEFGSMLKEVFEPATKASFRWERWAKLRGRIAHVYAYRVPQSTSKWTISYERRIAITPGYRGYLYVDRDVPTVLRVTLEAIDIPASFPVQSATTMLDYDYTDIAGNQFLLPLRAEVKMREGKLLARNLVEFRNYRKFGAEATITFSDIPEPLADDKTKEKPPSP